MVPTVPMHDLRPGAGHRAHRVQDQPGLGEVPQTAGVDACVLWQHACLAAMSPGREPSAACAYASAPHPGAAVQSTEAGDIMAGNNGGPQQPGGIREVARLAGVSVASASFALNGQPGVAEHTRQRILAAAEQLGYRANPQAQALRRGRTTTYGFVVRTFANPFFLDVLGGAEEVAEAAGATVLILDSRYSLERESMHVREMSGQRLAGLAIAPVGNGGSIRLWQNLRDGAPVVALNATADNIRGVSRVGPDNA